MDSIFLIAELQVADPWDGLGGGPTFTHLHQKLHPKQPWVSGDPQLTFYECRWSGGSTQRWWKHLNPTCCNQNCLNLYTQNWCKGWKTSETQRQVQRLIQMKDAKIGASGEKVAGTGIYCSIFESQRLRSWGCCLKKMDEMILHQNFKK